ncbi:MAG TPA: hypothetical protein VHX40_07155, partial [Acidimicrobiales bacterium]|nr:hypothetical protein [Acidimicrobiales bacterium]
DEPVAHLDLITEARLREALDPWLDGRTVLVAAHRPELVARIDRTAVLAGEVPEAEGHPVGARA